jgi:glycosyltransferase involved in cell wall biosynthesis
MKSSAPESNERGQHVLDQITPMILTLNEEPNIGRTLSRLTWAKRILVVDSGSTDQTLDIVRAFPQVVTVYRGFDTAAAQCNFGLAQIETEWVLSLDADYVLSEGLIEEISRLDPGGDIGGYWVKFVYLVFGRPLRASLYPPRAVLYRRSRAIYVDEGHAQRVSIQGRLATLRQPIYHDDRKPLARWFNSQARYASLEATHLLALGRGHLRRADRIRLLILPAPILIFFYTLLIKRCVLDGWPGWYYAFQRVCAETMLSIELIDRRLASK